MKEFIVLFFLQQYIDQNMEDKLVYVSFNIEKNQYFSLSLKELIYTFIISAYKTLDRF